MLPLFAGGNGGTLVHPAGPFVSFVTAFPAAAPVRAVLLLVALQALLCAAVPCAFAGDSGPAGTGVVLVLAPVATQAGPGAADWTSRAPVHATRIAGGSDAPVRSHVPAHAQVSMFSWREILFYAMVAVIAVGGYLAFTGGHGREQRKS